MDPTFVNTRPGKDAMGMDLIPVYEGDPGADLTQIQLSGRVTQQIGVRTAPIARQQLTRSIRSVARIGYDETTLAHVSMKFDGWIETLNVDETGQYVQAGQPLFEIYSPELVASAEEFLQASSANTEASHMQHLVRSARRRLLQFDLTEEQINRIASTGEVPLRLTVRSPSSGYVVKKSAFQGSFVRRGVNLFEIADLDRIWVYIDAYEYEAPWLSVGQKVEMELTYSPGQRYVSRVDYIYPFLDEVSRTIRVRAIFANPDLVFKPGMFATARILSELPEPVLVVPSEAVIHSGDRSVVFVALGAGRFEPRDLELGVEGDGGDYEVLAGLEEGERVVTSGQFLIDSESRLKEAVIKLLAPAPQAEQNGAEETSDPTSIH
jgi:Cu(I)/Ag(I) efflux system membrane fusion protein/cobalt-zinc-cadmium efflux system membrane fusion protein